MNKLKVKSSSIGRWNRPSAFLSLYKPVVLYSRRIQTNFKHLCKQIVSKLNDKTGIYEFEHLHESLPDTEIKINSKINLFSNHLLHILGEKYKGESVESVISDDYASNHLRMPATWEPKIDPRSLKENNKLFSLIIFFTKDV